MTASEMRFQCVFGGEAKDMNATIPYCKALHTLYDCPCTENCKYFIKEEEAYELVKRYLERKG